MSQAARQAWFGVAAYSFPCSCGFLRRDGRPAVASPLDAYGLIALAREHGLRRIEIPLAGTLPDQSDAAIGRLRAALDEAGLGLVVDSGVIEVEALRELLPRAARAGATVVRATVSGILEGARGGIAGGWDAHLAEMCRRVAALRPDLERHGITLAIENHQDATSDDLLALCAAGGERVGVTFDVVNPLAVGEEPFAFARKLGPHIRNVHLKDYQVTATPSGYRLLRCALGDGLIDWAAMLALLAEVAPGAPQQIELAALYARHIRLFDDDWLAGFPARDARALAPALRTLARHARPDSDPWQSPWERELPGDEVARWEREQFERSVGHLLSLA